MEKIDNKGFTLIELIITIVVLAILLSITGVAISNIFNKTKDKNYSLLINDINSAAEMYYQECNYMNPYENQNQYCKKDDDGNYVIQLSTLVELGFLSSSDSSSLTLKNPKDENDISDCQISIKAGEGIVTVSAYTDNNNESCPTSYEVK